MSERDIIARIESLETKLNKALRILVEQFGEPPQRTVEGPLIYVPTQQEIDEAIREGDELERQIAAELDQEEQDNL